MSASCREAFYPAYVIGIGDMLGMSVGVDTGAGYVRVGVLRDCRRF
jgi:hypothetical protein